jgi:hypothetical protein
MPAVGFETTNAAGERPKTYALDREATRTGKKLVYQKKTYSRPSIAQRIIYEPLYYKLVRRTV